MAGQDSNLGLNLESEPLGQTLSKAKITVGADMQISVSKLLVFISSLSFRNFKPEFLLV